jgi:formylglycine-generating enzyme required for sulfatase activity
MIRRKGVGLLLLMALVRCLCSAGFAGEGRPTEKVQPPPEVNPNVVVWRTSAPPASPQAGDVWVNPKAGAEMVYVPPGEFILGTSDAQIDSWLKEHPGDKRERFKDEQPQCRVRLEGYWIGRTEVTNAQYLRFVRATGHRAPEHWKGGQIPSGLENFPVVFVDWEDARAYCQWAGGRLPTELEWEKAARGTDGRILPWGKQWDSKRCRNLELLTGKPYTTDPAWVAAVQLWDASHDAVREGPAAVGSYPAGASPYGCLDMAGNVWEWCADWYEGDAYQRYAKRDLRPPTSGEYKVLRGGSWFDVNPSGFRCAYRLSDNPFARGNYYICYGFRCARGLP